MIFCVCEDCFDPTRVEELTIGGHKRERCDLCGRAFRELEQATHFESYTDAFIEHAARCSSQYDGVVRKMAAELRYYRKRLIHLSQPQERGSNVRFWCSKNPGAAMFSFVPSGATCWECLLNWHASQPEAFAGAPGARYDGNESVQVLVDTNCICSPDERRIGHRERCPLRTFPVQL